ncbi:helix-turn-helix domain-containing protein, partial [Listeria monocytogenes]|uniref:helix-turn-helix domain-containing protein n=1 Tax=Listeria monocytogenes TaxID=1639 RepID=UPI000BE71EFC
MSTRVMYPAEIKEKAIKMKLAGKSTKEIMRTLNIKNPTQVKTWWRWYRNEETQRFNQGEGKQYTYKKGEQELPEIEQLKIDLRQK